MSGKLKEVFEVNEAWARSVVLTGPLPAEMMKCAYAVSNVVLTPSLYPDPFPNVNLEAMVSSRPVVTTCFGGGREAVEDGRTGILVPSGDSGKLAEAVLHMVDDRTRSEQMAKLLKSEVLEKYTLTRMVERVQDLYSRLSAV